MEKREMERLRRAIDKTRANCHRFRLVAQPTEERSRKEWKRHLIYLRFIFRYFRRVNPSYFEKETNDFLLLIYEQLPGYIKKEEVRYKKGVK